MKKNSRTKRVSIPHTSWTTTFVWWKRRITRPIRNFILQKLTSKSYTPQKRIQLPAKGPQPWKFPPDAEFLNLFMREGESCEPREWEEQSSGWVMTIVSPPPRFKYADEEKTKGRLVMYLHGGGFHFPITKFHWAYIGYLARELDSEVVVVPVPLCPLNDGPGIMSAMTGIWDSFNTLAAGRETIVIGDSSGGLMALCLPFALQQLHRTSPSSSPIQPPSQVVAISPPTTFTPHWDPTIVPLDLILKPAPFDHLVRAWAGIPIPPGLPASSVPIPPHVLANAAINPIAGDFSLYKEQGIKLVISSGTWDILHTDIKVLVRKAERSGAEVTYFEGEHQFHAFPVAIDVAPECREASERLVRTIIENGRGVV